jgi:hypothetical protein
MSQKPNNQRSNVKNDNNPAYDADMKNRLTQIKGQSTVAVTPNTAKPKETGKDAQTIAAK